MGRPTRRTSFLSRYWRIDVNFKPEKPIRYFAVLNSCQRFNFVTKEPKLFVADSRQCDPLENALARRVAGIYSPSVSLVP